MSHNRLAHLNEILAEVKDTFREIEDENYQHTVDALLEKTDADPMSIYKDTTFYPRFVVWELTLACNMRCRHCGSTAGIGRKDELSLDEMLKVCDALGELECERLTLLGGEPLLHPHWEKVAERLKQNRVNVNVITNGWNLDDARLCDRLKHAGLSIVGLSIDGCEKSHDTLRQPGSFKKISKGMDLLRERGVPMAVSTVVTSDSIKELNELYDYIVAKGATVWQIQIAAPLGRLNKDDPILITPDRIKEIYDVFYEKEKQKDAIRIDIADNIGYFAPWPKGHIRSTRKRKGLWTGCHAGLQVLGIDSNGDIKGCQSLPSTPEFIEGNLRKQSLKEIWQNPNNFKYNRQFTKDRLNGYCAKCKYGTLCRAGCSSSAISFSGDIGDNPMCCYRAMQTKKSG